MIRVSVVELNLMEGLILEGWYVVIICLVKLWLIMIFEEEIFWIVVLIGVVDVMKKEK